MTNGSAGTVASRPVSTAATTATRGSRALGVAALVGVAWLIIFGLLISPPDARQGDSVRILYVHVPTAWIAYLAFIVTAGASALYLFTKNKSLGWDRLAGASAEVGVLFMGLTLVSGMVWGRLTWGIFWRWDARLTSTAFLFVSFVGYLAVRGLGGTHRQRAKRSGILALVLVPQIALVHFSVRIWNSLHQDATVANVIGTDDDRKVKMDGLMLFSLFVGIVAFTLLYVWLVMHRQRALTADDAVETVGLDAAIAERRAEVALAASGRAPGAQPVSPQTVSPQTVSEVN